MSHPTPPHHHPHAHARAGSNKMRPPAPQTCTATRATSPILRPFCRSALSRVGGCCQRSPGQRPSPSAACSSRPPPPSCHPHRPLQARWRTRRATCLPTCPLATARASERWAWASAAPPPLPIGRLSQRHRPCFAQPRPELPTPLLGCTDPPCPSQVCRLRLCQPGGTGGACGTLPALHLHAAAWAGEGAGRERQQGTAEPEKQAVSSAAPCRCQGAGPRQCASQCCQVTASSWMQPLNSFQTCVLSAPAGAAQAVHHHCHEPWRGRACACAPAQVMCPT